MYSNQKNHHLNLNENRITLIHKKDRCGSSYAHLPNLFVVYKICSNDYAIYIL